MSSKSIRHNTMEEFLKIEYLKKIRLKNDRYEKIKFDNVIRRINPFS